MYALYGKWCSTLTQLHAVSTRHHRTGLALPSWGWNWGNKWRKLRLGKIKYRNMSIMRKIEETFLSWPSPILRGPSSRQYCLIKICVFLQNCPVLEKSVILVRFLRSFSFWKCVIFIYLASPILVSRDSNRNISTTALRKAWYID